jgi:PhnB protein
MKTLNPYLHFAGQCRQALTFYESVFNGTVTVRQTYGQAPQAVSGANPADIMHAEFQAEGIYFMASDGINSPSNTMKDNIMLNITFTDELEQLTVFNALSENGQITMALSKTFWGAKFAMVKDKFGISWMLNHQINRDG